MILLAILFTCFSVYLELEVPTYISKITDLLGSQGTNLDELWQPASMMMGMPFLAFLSVVAVGFFASRVAASYTSRLRSDIFNRVLDYSQTEIKKFSIPSLLMRTTNDITQVQMLNYGLASGNVWSNYGYLGYWEDFRSFRILALGRTCGSDCQRPDDDRFDDASLSKTVLDSGADR